MKTRIKRFIGWSVIAVFCVALLLLASALLSLLFYDGNVKLSETELGLYISIAGIISLIYVGLRYFSEMSAKALKANALLYSIRFGLFFFTANVSCKTTWICKTTWMKWESDYPTLWTENAKRDITSFRGIMHVVIAFVFMLTVLWVIYHFVPAADWLFNKAYDLAVRISESGKEKRLRCGRESIDRN